MTDNLAIVREIPILSRKIEPHPGTGRFGHCAFCFFGNKRQVKSDVIIYTTYAHDERPAVRGLCSHHAEILEPIKKEVPIMQERNERRRGNNQALSNQIATSHLYRNIKQHFGPERGLAIIQWLQVGSGEKPTFDEECKAWFLSEDLANELRQAAERIEFSAFSTEHDGWVQITQDRYRELILDL